jgi:hypothetical protein
VITSDKWCVSSSMSINSIVSPSKLFISIHEDSVKGYVITLLFLLVALFFGILLQNEVGMEAKALIIMVGLLL